MYTLRTRFKKDIVVEFLPPARPTKKQRVIILADGMPSVPGKKPVLEFFSKKGFWVFHPRYRGSWESGGEFLEQSPHLDIKDVIDGIHKPFQSIWHKVQGSNGKFQLKPNQIILIGSSFGGPAVLLNSNDPRVSKVVAISPVTDWKLALKLAGPADKIEFIQDAFGRAYNVSAKSWKNLADPEFYNPIHYVKAAESAKILLIQARNDEIVPYAVTAKYAKATDAKMISLARGGHIGASSLLSPRLYKHFQKFIKN